MSQGKSHVESFHEVSLLSGHKMNFSQREKPQSKKSNGQGGIFSPRAP
jgi:hypothetical protein